MPRRAGSAIARPEPVARENQNKGAYTRAKGV